MAAARFFQVPIVVSVLMCFLTRTLLGFSVQQHRPHRQLMVVLQKDTVNTKQSLLRQQQQQQQRSAFIWSLSASGSSSAIAEDMTKDVSIPDGLTVYEALGIEEGKIAIGVKPMEVLKYVGTREDLIQKTMKDIPKFDRATAETEVDKFLMDAEMLNLYIAFGKELEKDPDFKVPEPPKEEEGLFSFRNIVTAYITYVGFDTGLQFYRNKIAEEQIAGTYEKTGVSIIDDWIERTTETATTKILEKAAQAASKAAEAVASTEATTTTMSGVSEVTIVQSPPVEVVQAVADAVQQVVQ